MLASTEYTLLHRVATEQTNGRAPSLVAAVVRDRQVVRSAARGYVNGNTPDNDTQYRIGSITKPLVATLVLRLRDEGRLDRADPVERHLPGTVFRGHQHRAATLARRRVDSGATGFVVGAQPGRGLG